MVFYYIILFGVMFICVFELIYMRMNACTYAQVRIYAFSSADVRYGV